LVVKRSRRVLGGLRVPLESYLSKDGSKVYSLVARVPFSPLDIDLGHLARGEWNTLTDRFRVWNLPREGDGGATVCYVMVRKFDPEDGVLLYGHMVVNIGKNPDASEPWSFTVGIMSNDEVRARSMLNSMLEIPPSFHKRSEVRLVEGKWRRDQEVVMRFLANVHSVLANLAPDPGGKMYTMKFEPPPGMMGQLTKGLGAWW
jgi:hypothetical protein